MKKKNLFELHEQVFLHKRNKSYYIKFPWNVNRDILEKRIYYVWAKQYLPVSPDHIEKRFIDANYENLLNDTEGADLDYLLLEHMIKENPKLNSSYLFALYIDRAPSIIGISRWKFLRLSSVIRRKHKLPQMPATSKISGIINVITPWDPPGKNKRVTKCI